jgi:hypothetical protein
MGTFEPVTFPQVHRGCATTPGERHLQRLAERSFLRLWSYPSPYTDRKPPKELCDLLVVFGDHLLLFSEKTVRFGQASTWEERWQRWYRRSVSSAARQLAGAERWIREHPDRVFADTKCEHRLPVGLPGPTSARVHRVVIAQGAGHACQEYFQGGSGSLLVTSAAVDPLLPAGLDNIRIPFEVGQGAVGGGVIHVLDEWTLSLLMTELDTIADLASYLTKKEALFTSGVTTLAMGEEELLGYYMLQHHESRGHDFVVPEVRRAGGAPVMWRVTEGHWEKWLHSPERSARRAADEVSYVWDRLIETFTGYLLEGRLMGSAGTRPEHMESALRLMAAENRLNRRMLGQSLQDFLHRPHPNRWDARVVFAAGAPGPHYVFVVLGTEGSASYEEYREERTSLLGQYCRAAKLRWPDAEDILGIACEPPGSDGGSADLLHYNARDWPESERLAAEEAQRELGLLSKVRLDRAQGREYPVADGESPSEPAGHALTRIARRPTTGKVGRNAPCPCGSGLKYKKCCLGKLD